MERFLRGLLIALAMLVAFGQVAEAQTDVIWRTDGPSGGNWNWGSTCEVAGDGQWFYNTWTGFRQRPDCFGTHDVFFDGNGLNTMNLNGGADFTVRRIIFNAGANAVRTLSTDAGRKLILSQNNGVSKIENLSSANHTFNVAIDIINGLTEINPVNGDLTFNGNITNGGNAIDVYGNNAHALNVNGVISGGGTLTVKQNSRVIFGNNQTYTGNTLAEAGEIWIASGGSIASGSAITVGSASLLANVAKFWISAPAGGTTVSNNLAIANGNATTREIGGLNSTGTHTYSGNITNNSTTGGLRLTALTSGGQTTFSGIISGAGAIFKEGAGTVRLSGASANSYTGTTTVNGGLLELQKNNDIIALPSATTIQAGSEIRTLNSNQWGTTTPPLVTINGNGLLNLNNTNQRIALASASTTSSVSLGSGTLTIDNGGTDTYAGVISGTGGVIKTGAGNFILSGSQSYTGTTTINAGTITAGGDMASSDIIVNSGGTFVVTSNISINNLTINDGGTVTIGLLGDLIVNGNVVMNGGTLSLSTNLGGVNLAQNFTKTGGTLNKNSGQVQFSGAGNQTFVSSTPETLNTVLVNNSAGSVFINSDITISGNGEALQLNNNSTIVVALGAVITMANGTVANIVNPGSSLTVNGTLRNTGTAGATINSTASQLIFSGSGTYDHNMTRAGTNLGVIPPATWNTGSTFLVSGLTSPSNGSWFTGGMPTFSNFTWNTPSMTTALNMSGATINVDNTFTMLSTGSGSVIWGTGSSGVLNCNFFEMSGGTINLASGSGIGTINCTNAFTHSGGTITESGSGSGLINFNGTSTQFINTTGGTITERINHRFANTAGYNLTGSITVNSGAFVSMRAGSFSGTGNFVYNGTSSTLLYDGSSPITTSAYEFPSTNGPVSLTLDNSGGDITLHDNRSLPTVTTSVLTLTNGRLILGSNNLELLRANTAALTTGSASSYIIQDGSGRLVRSIPTGVNVALFPLGETGGYTPFEISFTANNTARTLFVDMFATASPDILIPNTPPDYLQRYFVPELSTTTGTYTYSISKLGYLAADVVGTAANLNVSTFDVSAWNDLATTAGNPLVGTGTLTQANGALLNRTFTGRNSSAKYTWNGSQNNGWDNVLNWTPNGFPSPTDEVTIDVPGTNELIVSGDITIKKLVVNGTGVLNVSGFGELTVLTDFETSGSAEVNLDAGSILNIAGTFTYAAPATANFNCSSNVRFTSTSNVTVPALQYGNLVLTGGARTLAPSGTIGICGDYTAVAAASTTVTGSTVRFNGTTAQSIGGVATRFATLEIANTLANVTPAVATTVLTALVVNNNARLDIATGITLTITGSTSVVNGFLRSSGTITGASAVALTFGATGTYEHNWSTAQGIIPASTWSAGSTCKIMGYQGLFTLSSGGGWGQAFSNFTWDCQNQLSTANFNFVGLLTTIGGNFSINSTGSGTLIYNSNSPVAPILSVGGDFLLADGVFRLNNGTSTPTMRVAGNFTIVNGTLTRSTATTLTVVEFNGTGAQTLTIPTAGQVTNAISFKVNNSAGIVLATGTDLPINNNANLFRTAGTITGAGLISYPGATTALIYDGSTNITTSDKEWPATGGPSNLTINNSAALSGSGVTLHAARSLPNNGALTMTAGKLTLGNNSLTLLNSAAAALSGGSSSAFLATSGTGQLIRALATGANTYLYPVGNGANYTPASFAFTANSTARNLGVRAPASTHPNMAPNPTVFLQNIHWLTTLSVTTGTYSYTPTFTFVDPTQVSGSPVGDLGLARWDGVVWSVVSEAATVSPNLTSPSLNQGNGSLNNIAWTGRRRPDPTIYTWAFAGNGSWTIATNWSPNGVPTTGDEVQFTHAASYSVSNVPVGITLRKMSFSGGGTTTLFVNNPGTVSFKGGINPLFDVASGTGVVISGNLDSDWIIESGATGSIEGNVRLRGLSSTTPHTLQAADAGALRFRSGSYFAAGVLNTTNFSGNPFGDTGTSGTVVFESGSVYEHFDGANPFGTDNKVVFETGSLYRYSDTNPNVFALPSLSGRTYANFEYNSTQSKTNSSGGSGYTMDDLTVTQGNYAINLDVSATIRGDITVAAGSTLQFSPAGINRVITLNGSTQDINTNGTGVLQVNGSGNGFTVVSGTTVNMVGESAVTGTGRFTLNAGATLGIESVDGITRFIDGNLGNIQTTTRSYATAANYVYQRNGNQSTGFGLPGALVTGGSITIAATGTVTHTPLGTSTSTPTLNLTSGLFDNTGETIVILSGGTINATAGDFTAAPGGGIVSFNAGATSNVNADGVLNFNNVNLVGGSVSGVNFGATGTPTIHGNLTINAGRFVDTNAPVYATGSTLIYNAVGTYGRGVEWGTTSGRGFPHNVTLSGSTTLQPGANSNQNTPMSMGGNLTINNLSRMYLDWGTLETTQDLVVPGNVLISGDGQLSLSTVSGDLRLGGNWTRASGGAFNPRQRAVITTGTADQIILMTPINNTETFNYLVNIKPSGNVILGTSTNLNINGNVGNVLVLSENSDLDLNGRTLNVNSPSGTRIQLPVNGVSNITGAANSRFIISSGNKEIGSTGAALIFGPNVILELQSGLDCGTDLTTVEGVLQISAGGFVDVRAPFYPPGSVLRYATGGPYGRGAEWNTLTGTGFPYNVEVIQNVNPTVVDLFNGSSAIRRIAGNLTLNAGGTLNMDNITSQLQVLGNVQINAGGTLNLGNVFGGDITIAGNLTRNTVSGVLNQNGREIVMNGNAPQTITGVTSIDRLAVDNDGSEVLIVANTTINSRLRLTRGTYNLNGRTNTMADGSEILRQAATATMSAAPSVSGSSSYDLRYNLESFTTGVEYIGTNTGVRDLIIEGVTTTLGDSRTFNRSLFLNGANLNLNGNVLSARGRGVTASGQIVASQAGVRNINGVGRFDIVGLGGSDPIARTKQFVSNNGATLVFGEDVEVRIGDGGCDFGAGNPVTIEGILSVRGGGYVIENAVNYAANSLLRFSNGFDYQVDVTDLTWASGDILLNDPGIPYNVEVLFNTPNNTELVLNTPRALRNNLNIDGGVFTLTPTAGTFRIGGTWSRTGTNSAFNHNEQEVIFDGFDPVVQTITTDVGIGETFYLLSFENSALKDLGEDINVELDLTIRGSSGVLSGNTHDIRIGREWVNEISPAAFNEGTSNVVFNGTIEANRITATNGGETFARLEVDNSSGLGLLMEDEVRITQNMTFTEGVVQAVNGTDELVFLDGANWSGASNASFAAGWVRCIGFDGSAYKEYPTGYLNTVDAVQEYMPAGVSAVSASATAAYRVRYFHENEDPNIDSGPNTVWPVNAPLERISTCNWWDVERVGDNLDAFVRLYWDEASGCYEIVTPSELTVAHKDGTTWETVGTQLVNVITANVRGWVQTGPFNSFSPFTIGSIGTNNALPISLLHFDATALPNETVRCEWTTATEVNNDFFNIERSRDGVLWESVGRIAGAGNSNTPLSYAFIDDAPHRGISYYRLRQTDFDGTTETFDPKAVQIGSEGGFALLQVYRSEGSLTFTYRATAPYLTTEIYDVSGRLVHGSVIANDDNDRGLVEVNLARGVYVFRLADNFGNVETKRFFW